MNIEKIDEAIDQYVNERMAKGQETARERFLAYAYLKNRGDDVADFLAKVKGFSRYYIDFLQVMQNPFKGPELAWLASMSAIAVYAVILMASEEQRSLGIFLLVGTVINATALLKLVMKKWCDLAVMIAIYRELLNLAETELKDKA